MSDLTNKLFDQIVEDVYNEVGNKIPLFDRVLEGHLSIKMLEYDIEFQHDEMLLLQEAIRNKITNNGEK